MTAVPPPYDRQASFTGFSTEQSPTVGQNLEAEFNKIDQVIDATQSRLAEIQRDDGQLRNLSVHPDALNGAVRALLAATGDIEGDWGTGLIYTKADVVRGPDGVTYLAAVDHVAGAVFATDLAAGRWLAIDSAGALDDLLRSDLADTGASPGSGLIGHAGETLEEFLDGGAAKTPFTQVGANAVERTVAPKLQLVLSPEDFGALANGVADDTLAIQRAENALAALGGGVLMFENQNYRVSSTLTKRSSNVLWRGRGAGHEHDAGSGNDAGTAMIWIGAAGGTMIDFAPATGASARRISGGGIVDIGLYGGGVAARGLVMKSVHNADIHVYGEDFTTAVMETGVVSPLGEAPDLQQCRISLYFKQVGASSGKGLVLGGDSVGNTSVNKIHLRGAYKNATALELANCDNNEIHQWTFRFGGGSGIGVDSLGGTSAAVAARANTWVYLYAGDGGVRLRGTGDGYAAASTRNRFLMWDNDNAQPLPVAGTGCDYTLLDHDGRMRLTELFWFRPQANFLDFHTGTDPSIANNPRLFRLQFSPSATGYLTVTHDATPNVIMRAQGDVAANVGMAIVTKGTGRGFLFGADFASAPLQWEHTGGASKIAFHGTAPIAKPALPAAATDAATTQALANAIRTLLINYGLAS